MATEVPEIAKEKSHSPTLKLTDKAIEQVKTILARERLEGHGLRVSVVGGGCSGFSYGLDFENQQRPGDTVLEMDGIKVYVDDSSVGYLHGTVLDYVSGLNETGFKFINPNVKSTCGCGTSFSA